MRDVDFLPVGECIDYPIKPADIDLEAAKSDYYKVGSKEESGFDGGLRDAVLSLLEYFQERGGWGKIDGLELWMLLMDKYSIGVSVNGGGFGRFGNSDQRVLQSACNAGYITSDWEHVTHKFVSWCYYRWGIVKRDE